MVRVVTTALRRPQTYTGWLRELAGAGTCVARYPLGIAEAGLAALASLRPMSDLLFDTPVVLVHGYGHNRSGWFALEHRLRHAGFANVVTLNYNPLTADVPALAERLAERVDAVRDHTGAERVHVVGHSLGGVMLRWYVQEAGGHEVVGTAVTVASPHEGTLTAFAGFGRTAQQLRPGSWVMRRLAHGARPTPVHWIAYYSNIDVFVQPGRSAMIRHPALDATNVLVKDQGHLSILLSPAMGRSIVAHLSGVGGEAGGDGHEPLQPAS